MSSGVARCVAHPARRAVDRCPVCARDRCAVDVAQWAGRGCPACRATPEPGRGAKGRAVLVRAGLAGAAVALVGGVVSTEYVGTRYFSVVVPALVGVAASWAVTAAAGGGATGRGGRGYRVALLVLAGAAALLGTALGFRLVPGGQGLLSPVGDVAPPYAAAVAGALAWPLLSGAAAPSAAPSRSTRPRRRRQPGRGSDA